MSQGKRSYIIRKIPDEGYLRNEKIYFVSIEEGKNKAAPRTITWNYDIKKAKVFEHIAEARETLTKGLDRLGGRLDIMPLWMALQEEKIND